MRKWLPDRLDELHKSKSALARALGLAPARVTEIINATRNIQSNEVEPMARFLEWPDTYLLAMIGGRTVANVRPVGDPIVPAPVISWVQAGQYSEIYDPYPPGAHEREVFLTYGRTTLIALEVHGGSMKLVAPEGSTIVVDYADKTLVSGKYYVIKHNGEATFKRYRSSPDRFEPCTTEDGHETIYPDGPVEIVGRVVKVLNDL